MQLQVNGEVHHFSSVNVVDDVLRELGYEPQKIAVAINGEFVPRSQYGLRAVNGGECFDIVAPVQGG